MIRSTPSREFHGGLRLRPAGRVLPALLCLLLLAAVLPGVATADEGGWQPADSIDLELGLYHFTRNDVRIPNPGGTKFALDDLTGSNGSDLRLQGTWWWNERNALRLTVAPISIEGAAVADDDIEFAGADFAAGERTLAEYRFNTYRLTWRYRFFRGERWDWSGGAAVLVRDARIRLTQGDLSAKDDDLGFVPLLHLHGRHRFTERTELVVDLEGAWAPQGRAIDLAVRVEHAFTPNWVGHVGVRTLEGGADNSNVFTFAWIHFATLGVGYRF